MKIHTYKNESGRGVFDIEIFINGKTPAELLGKKGRYYFDIGYFLQSFKRVGRHFIFTCDCGDPGCGGWDEGILISRDEENVYWLVDENTESTIEFVFPEKIYNDFTGSLKNMLQELLKKEPDQVFDRGQGEALADFDLL